MGILFEKEIVDELNDYNLKNDQILDKSEFAKLLNKKIRLHAGFPNFSTIELDHFMENTISDCIEYGYFVEKYESKVLLVTKNGRDFLTFFGLIEEFLKRRKRTITTPLALIIGALITWLFTK